MTTDFIHGRPMKQIVVFSLPIMLSSLLQYTYNMVDNIIVGRYVSTNALAAVGNIAPISSFAIGAAFGLAIFNSSTKELIFSSVFQSSAILF